MPSMITTVWFGDAVSRWITLTSFSRMEHRALFTPFLRLPSAFASEYGTEDSSKLNTSFRQIWQVFDTIRSLPNKSLSALTVTSLSLDFTWIFLFALLNVLMFMLGMGSQKPTELLLMRFSMKSLICCRPFSVLWRRVWATSSGRTTPVAILRSASESWVKGSVIKLEEKHPIIFWTSSSSRLTLLGAASLCDACSPSWRPYIVFKAEVIDARSWIVKNHRSRAAELWDMPITPPLDLESALIDCSRAMSAETCEKGCPERLMEWFPAANSLYTSGCVSSSRCMSAR